MDQVDFVITGGGSAGCVLAARLSEDPNCKIVLLEAGGSSDTFLVNMPAGCYKLLGQPEFDWSYKTEPDASIKGRVGNWSAGRTLGGGSAINGLVYIRGARADFDGWATEKGCAGWSWDEVLPYFRKSEDFAGGESETHGVGGPLGVSPLRITHPLADAFVDACTEVGLRRVPDYCTGDVDGAFINHTTQQHGERSSTARAFLGMAAHRSNLKVITGALVDRVLFEDRRAIGVRYTDASGVHDLGVRREVILCGGAIQSPALLMRSGVGPATHLKSLGLDVVADAPEVGRNLQEHASFGTSWFVNVPTYNQMMGPLHMARALTEYLVARRGILTTTPVHAMAFARSAPELTHPDIKLSMGPMAFDPVTRRPHERSSISVYVNASPPASQGEIRLRSTNPGDAPIIDMQLLGDDADVRRIIAGLKLVDRVCAAPALAKFITGRLLPAQTPKSDDEWEDQLRTYTSIGYHPVATCRMGGDAASVVDPELRVRGVTGLRVIDASVMPEMPSANTNAPTIMFAERGADLIKGKIGSVRAAPASAKQLHPTAAI